MVVFYHSINLEGGIFVKTLRILYLMGCISLLITSIFRIIDLAYGNVIPLVVHIPLCILTLIGMICGIVWIVKKKRADKNE